MSLFEDASLIVTPNGRKAGKIYTLKPFNGTGDLTVVRATTKTEVNASGVIVNVPINVPSFDYTNGSCPSILVEPQRTNLLKYSEQFDNVLWVNAGATTTVTANDALAPNGTLTADKFVVDGANGVRYQTFTATSGQTYTFSCWLKGTAGETLYFGCSTLGMTNIAITLTDDWVRYTHTMTTTSSGIGSVFPASTYAGGTARTFWVWGAQLEAGSNATSYIPTVASTVTRNADVISKTGISDLIGQTEGTIFVDVDFNNSASKIETNRIIGLTDGTNSNRIIVAFGSTNTLLTRVTASGVEQASFLSTSISVGVLKIVLSYSSSGVKLYVNGTLVQSNLSASIPATNRMNLGYEGTTSLQQLNDGINSVALWKTQLTDQQCINLTTP